MTKESLARDIRTKATEIASHVAPPRGKWDSFVLELLVGELETMVRIYRELPHNR